MIKNHISRAYTFFGAMATKKENGFDDNVRLGGSCRQEEDQWLDCCWNAIVS